METIGQRAAKAIKKRVRRGEWGIELKKLGIPNDTFYSWVNARNNPSAYYLQQMALAGYDVIYILTGKENKKC